MALSQMLDASDITAVRAPLFLSSIPGIDPERGFYQYPATLFVYRCRADIEAPFVMRPSRQGLGYE